MAHQLVKVICFAVLLLQTSCGNTSMPESTIWHGFVNLPEARVLLTMELRLDGAKPAGNFIVGTEKIPIPEISRVGQTLTFNFSEYGAEITATWSGKELTGEYRRLRSTGTKAFPFRARPDTDDAPTVTTAPAGTFQVLFEDQTLAEATTVATIWKEGQDSHYGTFIAPDGDYGLLEGSSAANGILFSRFTGWQAIAIELRQAGANWSGIYHAAHNDKPRAFTLLPRSASASGKQTTMKNPRMPFAFACTSLTGETIRNTDDRFKGKALAVDIMGTWCHNCMDESPVLEKFRRQYGKDGFEVVGLSFEIKDDAELGKKNLSLFRDRYGLTYPLLYCGSLDDANVDKQIKSQLDNFFAYPTTLFVDKQGKVKTIHSGFRGPGTGTDQHAEQLRKLEELVQQVLQ
jgi:thiol-disulfide isomerase/thioredoxin